MRHVVRLRTDAGVKLRQNVANVADRRNPLRDRHEELLSWEPELLKHAAHARFELGEFGSGRTARYDGRTGRRLKFTHIPKLTERSARVPGKSATALTREDPDPQLQAK